MMKTERIVLKVSPERKAQIKGWARAIGLETSGFLNMLIAHYECQGLAGYKKLQNNKEKELQNTTEGDLTTHNARRGKRA